MHCGTAGTLRYLVESCGDACHCRFFSLSMDFSPLNIFSGNTVVRLRNLLLTPQARISYRALDLEAET